MKILDALYNSLCHGEGSISIDDFHNNVLRIDQKTDDSYSLIASIVTMDGRFIFDGNNIILRPQKNDILEKQKKSFKETLIKRLVTEKNIINEKKLNLDLQGNIFKTQYVAIDFETTGFSPLLHKVIEIGAVKIKNGVIVEKFKTFVDPGGYIPSFITQLTGITTDMVDGSPGAEVAFLDLYDFMFGANLVAHNYSFDSKFLSHNLAEIGLSFLPVGFCTMKLARRFLKYESVDNAKLHTVAAHFGIPVLREHRALEDANTAAEIFIRFLDMADKSGLDTIEKLYNFQTLSTREV